MAAVASTTTTVEPAGYVAGRLAVPGDKSIAHRYAILAALATGRTSIQGYAPGADCGATLTCLEGLGVAVDRRGSSSSHDAVLLIDGVGVSGLAAPGLALDAGNSGTTMRLLAGVLSAQPFVSVLTGDASLRKRPMHRIVEPLARMGATVESTDGRPPLTVHGAKLRGITHDPAVASAQVKSAVLLAGLQARGETWVREPAVTRDHTERALRVFGAVVRRAGLSVGVSGGQPLTGQTLTVPGDFSSAAFWFAAAAGLPGSSVTVVGVGLNPTRTRLLDVLRRAGATVQARVTGTTGGEPFGEVTVQSGDRHPVEVTADEVPALIDELPALAALGVHGGGLVVRGASELRAKESDRIRVLVEGLRHLGAEADEHPDGFVIHGRRRPTGGTVDAAGDHRMAMAFAVAALAGTGPTVITRPEVVDVSYPSFFSTLDSLRRV